MEHGGNRSETAAVVNDFHRLYYESRSRTWSQTFWLGHRAEKCPLDLWIYQEIIGETKPDIIVETGTAAGGSALYLASVCDLLGNGCVVSIDIAEREGRPLDERIRYLIGSSTDQDVLEHVRALVPPGASVMAILDSDHTKAHVLDELRAYGRLVTPGNYLVVEDTNVNGHPVRTDFGPGPFEAVEEFLGETDAFELDRSREKFFMTFNPRGYLRRRQ